MTDDDKEHLQMIDDCEKRESKLSDWQATFIDSLSTQLDKGKSLSEKQATILERIWDKVTS